ncbi:MAG: fasciclin domain-containing protein [Acidobacteriaceae bacterium]|nr:fasciclin domain-containing protein [Acidobacteriaceae bacterium]
MASQEGINQDQTVDAGIDDKLQTHDMAGTLARLKECSLFYEIIEKAGLHGALGRSGLYTLFAPNNAAIGNHPPGDPLQYLERHMLSGAMRSEDLRGLQSVKTTAGTTLPVSLHGTAIHIGSATVQRADVPCTNGVLHVVSASLTDTAR